MGMIRWKIRSVCYTLALLMMSCSGQEIMEDGDTSSSGVFVEQEIQMSVASGNYEGPESGTRALPPGSDTGREPGTCRVDRIRLLVFRRIENSQDPFLYDASNSTTSKDNDLKCEGLMDIQTHRLFKGKITKEKGYEYRVMALGYATKQKPQFAPIPEGQEANYEYDESGLFEIQNGKGSTVLEGADYNQIELVVIPHDLSQQKDKTPPLNMTYPGDFIGNGGGESKDGRAKNGCTGYYMQTPEFFYGTPKSIGKESPIITFYDTNKLVGTLLRGVARLEFTLGDVDYIIKDDFKDVWRIGLMAESKSSEGLGLYQKVNLSDYDNFHTPDAPWETALTGYAQTRKATLVTAHYMDFIGENVNLNNNVTLSAFFLPARLRMFVRTYQYKKKWIGDEKKTQDYMLDLANTSSGDGATGIISPDFGGEILYLRRNHLYRVVLSTKDEVSKNTKAV